MPRAWLLLTPAILLTSYFSPLTSHLSLLTSSVSALQDRPVFRAASELVVLHVSVRDRGGRYVTGLERGAFTVIDAGTPQTIEMFSADDVPASVALLIDNSNSMRPHREIVIRSAVEFARHSHPRDEIVALTFNEVVHHAWGPSIAGGTDLGRFASAMSQAIVARGMSAIYDGIFAGLRWLETATHSRQVLIVVSDGDDNASSAGVDQVIARVRESDAAIYTIALTDPLTRDGNPRLLRRLSDATGGESFQPRRVAQVADAFEAIAADIRGGYTIAYTPTAATWNDQDERRRRTVRVYVRSKEGRTLRVRTRDGYFERTRNHTP